MNRYKALIKYELISMFKGGYIPAFGVALPVLLFILVGKGVLSNVPADMKSAVLAKIFISLATIIPLAIVFLGYASSYSRDCELEIPQRLQLFGIPTKVSLFSKIIAQLIFVGIGYAIYLVVGFINGLVLERPFVILVLFGFLIIQSILQFLLAHGIVRLCKKFGPTYAISMICYFGFMIVSGNMGIQIESLPVSLQFIGNYCLPFVSSTDYTISFLMREPYHSSKLFISYVAFLGISLVLLFIARLRDKRGLRI